jgi:hypothetical protein
MSLDDSELENEPASLPECREARWEQVYVDGNTRLVQRHDLVMQAHDFVRQEPATVCISTPTGELDDSLASSFKSGDTTLPLSVAVAAATAELQRPTTPQSISKPRNATFSDRVHELSQKENSPLAALEDEIGKESMFGENSRTGTGFGSLRPFSPGPPLHQDSGFSEPTVGMDNFVGDVAGIRALEVGKFGERDGRVEGTLWEEVEQGVAQLNIGESQPREAEVRTRKSEEKGREIESAGTEKTAMRPPSIMIPEFHRQVPRVVDVDEKIEAGKL